MRILLGSIECQCELHDFLWVEKGRFLISSTHPTRFCASGQNAQIFRLDARMHFSANGYSRLLKTRVDLPRRRGQADRTDTARHPTHAPLLPRCACTAVLVLTTTTPTCCLAASVPRRLAGSLIKARGGIHSNFFSRSDRGPRRTPLNKARRRIASLQWGRASPTDSLGKSGGRVPLRT